MRKELKNPVRVNVILEGEEWTAFKKRAKLSLSKLLRTSMRIYLDSLSKK